jgi:Recombinase
VVPCFECGRPASEDHHVVPQSEGGTKTVPLCAECHARAHGGELGRCEARTISELTRSGLVRARARGVRLGRPPGIPDETRRRIRHERDAGASLAAIAVRLNRDGVASGQGGRWWASTVRWVLEADGVGPAQLDLFTDAQV